MENSVPNFISRPNSFSCCHSLSLVRRAQIRIAQTSSASVRTNSTGACVQMDNLLPRRIATPTFDQFLRRHVWIGVRSMSGQGTSARKKNVVLGCSHAFSPVT